MEDLNEIDKWRGFTAIKVMGSDVFFPLQVYIWRTEPQHWEGEKTQIQKHYILIYFAMPESPLFQLRSGFPFQQLL